MCINPEKELAMVQQIRVSAYGLILRDKKMLLCRLSSHLSVSAGLWTLPGGGLDFGESPEDAVVREVSEETGLTVTTGLLRGVDSICDSVAQSKYHSIRILYDAHFVEGELRFEQDGTTDACDWFTQQQIEGLAMVDLARLGSTLAFG